MYLSHSTMEAEIHSSTVELSYAPSGGVMYVLTVVSLMIDSCTMQ